MLTKNELTPLINSISRSIEEIVSDVKSIDKYIKQSPLAFEPRNIRKALILELASTTQKYIDLEKMYDDAI